MYMHAKRQTRSMQRQSLQSPNLSGPDSGKTGEDWNYANASFIGVNEPGGRSGSAVANREPDRAGADDAPRSNGTS